MAEKERASRQVIVISLITAACLIGDSMLYIVLPICFAQAGLSSLWEVGIILSVNRLVRLPLNPIVGWLYRHISDRTGIFIATVLATITTFSYAFANGSSSGSSCAACGASRGRCCGSAASIAS